MVRHADCPLCSTAFERETDLRVHLEVEHRKSELARHLVENEERSEDPVAERDPVASNA